jgi:hypothetical protein
MDEKSKEKFWAVVGSAMGTWALQSYQESSVTDFIDALFGYGNFQEKFSTWSSGEGGKETRGFKSLRIDDFRVKLGIDDDTSRLETMQKMAKVMNGMNEAAVKSGFSEFGKINNVEDSSEDDLLLEIQEKSGKLVENMQELGPDKLTKLLRTALKENSEFKELGNDEKFGKDLGFLFDRIAKGNANSPEVKAFFGEENSQVEQAAA